MPYLDVDCDIVERSSTDYPREGPAAAGRSGPGQSTLIAFCVPTPVTYGALNPRMSKVLLLFLAQRLRGRTLGESSKLVIKYMD